jgi:hypothetical protein
MIVAYFLYYGASSGCGWRRRPPDREDIAEILHGVVFELGG